jgi:hypothetical protein
MATTNSQGVIQFTQPEMHDAAAGLKALADFITQVTQDMQNVAMKYAEGTSGAMRNQALTAHTMIEELQMDIATFQRQFGSKTVDASNEMMALDRRLASQIVMPGRS